MLQKYTVIRGKDFEHIEGMNVFERSGYFVEFQEYLERQGHFNYRLESQDGCGPVMRLKLPDENVPRECVCLVSNDYLGFTQHPAIKATHKWAIDQFGSGAGASPAIGGHFNYHSLLGTQRHCHCRHGPWGLKPKTVLRMSTLSWAP